MTTTLQTAPILRRTVPGPGIAALAQRDSFIILGKGKSRARYAEYRSLMEGSGFSPALLTLNNFFPGGSDPEMAGFDLPATTDLHFDVHYDQRFWEDMRGMSCRCVVSPFRAADIPDGQPWEAFPLALMKRLNLNCYIESTLDFMLASIVIAHLHAGQPLEGKVVSLPGCDMQDPTHFAYRFGMHYWLGILHGRGATMMLPPEGAALKRYAGRRCADTEPDFPHIYGQPWDVTEPYAKEYGWE